jgi:hypothetical protein
MGEGARGAACRPCRRPWVSVRNKKTSLVALLECCTGLFLQRLRSGLRKARRTAAVLGY